MVDSSIKRLYADLRDTPKGKWAAFLGAGASYDYGIPTMIEMSAMLREMIMGDKPEHEISSKTLETLKLLLVTTTDDRIIWNIEQLLTRLHQLHQASSGAGLPFVPTTAAIGKKELDPEDIQRASNELLLFLAKMCELSAKEHADHGNGSVEYLSDFIRIFSAFGNVLNIFTVNIDLCIEAAMVRLSQRPRQLRRPDFPMVDGFDTCLVPTFDLSNYRRNISPRDDLRPVYYWKLHGSVDWTFSSPLGESPSSQQSDDGNEDHSFNDQSIIMRKSDIGRWEELHKCDALSLPPDTTKGRIAIFPTPEKYLQTYTFPYMDLFEAFRRTLEEIELLLVVGTSFPDQHILSAVRSFVQRDNVQLFVVDPSMNRNKLVELFGDFGTIQPVISMGFNDFIQQFAELESLEEEEMGDSKLEEAKSE